DRGRRDSTPRGSGAAGTARRGPKHLRRPPHRRSRGWNGSRRDRVLQGLSDPVTPRRGRPEQAPAWLLEGSCVGSHDQDPYRDVHRHEVVPPADHLRVEDRLASELPARFAREEEGLVRLDRGDAVARRPDPDVDPVVGEEREQDGPEEGNAGAAEELERLESLDGSVLPRAAEGGQPAAEAPDRR